MRNPGAAATLSVAAVAMLCAVAAFADEQSLEQRVQQAEDVREINDRVIDYGLFLERKEFESSSRLFARNGTWSGGTTNFVPVKGPAAIRDTMEKAFAKR